MCASAAGWKQQAWPKRAVITAGMPYGNKPLHFGHIAGVFVPADCYARFLRDRIGADKVYFVSGTDCYGSPIDEGYRKLVESGSFSGSIREYVQRNHDAQAKTLTSYDISLDIYEGSGIGNAGKRHEELTDAFLRRLYENGWLKLRSTMQFYDASAGVFLNGRQVVGRCPVQGCKSDHGYADECDLGHSYAPEELIAPVSTVTNTTPEMRPVQNWYFDLPAFRDFLCQHVEQQRIDDTVRPIVAQTCSEFLGAPIIYVKNDEKDLFDAVAQDLPDHVVHEPEKGKASFAVEFATIDDRDSARDVLRGAGLRFRTGKALVPFRITGNIEWGVAAPQLEDEDNLTVWCWPESLWAPISFTRAALDARGLDADMWRDYWCSDDAQVYQFIGQDNLYFYGVAQPALWQALQPGSVFVHEPSQDTLRQTHLVANYHVLYGKKKASSSAEIKPPTADELLQHYTADQLRAHFLSLGLGQKSVGFSPKAFDPDPAVRDDPRVADPALKESKLLTGVFNRLARSVLYEAKKNFSCTIPLIAPSQHARDLVFEVLSQVDQAMKRTELHAALSAADAFLRAANKHWSDGIAHVEAAATQDASRVQDDFQAQDASRIQDNSQTQDASQMRSQVLADAAYLLWVGTLVMHPIVPRGCEDICNKLQFDPAVFFSWQHSFESLAELETAKQAQTDMPQSHAVAELPTRYDFFCAK